MASFTQISVRQQFMYAQHFARCRTDFVRHITTTDYGRGLASSKCLSLRLGFVGTCLSLLSHRRALRGGYFGEWCRWHGFVSRDAIGVSDSSRLKKLAKLAADVKSRRSINVQKSNLLDKAYYQFASTYLKGSSPQGFCNWLIRDILMVGRYPFCDPTHDCPTMEESRLHLKRVIQAGVTCFVCLQAELPPMSAVVSDAWPPNGIPLMHYKFPNRFLPYGPPAAEEAAAQGHKEPSFLHTPIRDMGVPTESQLCNLLENCLEELLMDGCLYVHCWGGLGRAGVTSACLLALLQPELGPEEVLICTQAGYDSRVGGQNFQSPQTWQQRALVRAFVLRLQHLKDT